MARAENPGRTFSTEGEAADLADLKGMLAEREPALPYNEAAKLRIGKAITDAVLPSCVRPPARRLGSKGGGAL